MLGLALTIEKNARAQLFGSGGEHLARELGNLPAPVRRRIAVAGLVPHLDLVPAMQRAQIVLCTSRMESFHLASAEGLCSGCSVVGPAEIPSMHWFTSEQSGTLAVDRSDAQLAAALGCELATWRTGARDPVQISAKWRGRFTARAVAAEVLRRLEEAGAAEPCGSR